MDTHFMSYFLQTTCNKFSTVQHTEKEKEIKFQLYHITTHDITFQRIKTTFHFRIFRQRPSSLNERKKWKILLNLYWKYIDFFLLGNGSISWIYWSFSVLAESEIVSVHFDQLRNSKCIDYCLWNAEIKKPLAIRQCYAQNKSIRIYLLLFQQ